MADVYLNVTLELNSPYLEPKLASFKVLFYNETSRSLYNVRPYHYNHAYEGVDS